MNEIISINQQFSNPIDESEFEFFDGEDFIKFNIIEVIDDAITVAVTNRGRISVYTYDLICDSDRMYFEYGPLYTQINLEEYEEVTV